MVSRRQPNPVETANPAWTPRPNSPLEKTPHKARVIRDGAMAAAGALIQMAAHRGGAAPLDGYEYFEVQPGEPRGRPVHESVAGGGYDIGQLQEWPFHLFLAGTVFRVRGRREGERVEWAGGRFEMALRQVQVTAGRLQIGVAQQQLNGTQICAGFEQVGSEAVPPMPHAA